MSKKKHEWTRKGVTASMAVVLAFGMVPAVPTVALAQGDAPETGSAVSSETTTESEPILVSNYNDLVSALNSVTAGSVIKLASDITLDGPLPGDKISNKALTIDGNHKTISFDKDVTTGAVFGNNTNPLYSDTDLTVRDLKIVNTNGDANGSFASIVGIDAAGAKVTYEGCTFTNLYAPVYVNWLTSQPSEVTSVVIRNCTYSNTHYGYSVDDTTGPYQSCNVTFENNSGYESEKEIFNGAIKVSNPNENYNHIYKDIASAVNAAASGATIELAPGTYTLASSLVIDESITLQGAEGESQPCISFSNGYVSVKASDVALRNLTIDVSNIAGNTNAIKNEGDYDLDVDGCILIGNVDDTTAATGGTHGVNSNNGVTRVSNTIFENMYAGIAVKDQNPAPNDGDTPVYTGAKVVLGEGNEFSGCKFEYQMFYTKPNTDGTGSYFASWEDMKEKIPGRVGRVFPEEVAVSPVVRPSGEANNGIANFNYPAEYSKAGVVCSQSAGSFEFTVNENATKAYIAANGDNADALTNGGIMYVGVQFETPEIKGKTVTGVKVSLNDGTYWDQDLTSTTNDSGLFNNQLMEYFGFANRASGEYLGDARWNVELEWYGVDASEDEAGVSKDDAELIATSNAVVERNEYIAPAPTPTPDEGVSVTNPDGSATTTEETAEGTVETTVSKDESVTTVVEKDASGNVTKVEAEVSQAAVDAAGGAPVALPMAEPVEPAAAEDAPAISVKAPAGAKVAVPVAAAEGSKAPAPGAVLAVVDAEGGVTVLPKTAVAEGALAAEVPGDCTLKVVDASADFPDVSEGDWFAYAADFASARGILAGSVDASGAVVFDPSGEVTRGMFVAMLNRVESRPSASEGFEGFGDVADDSWYAQAADWGAEQGIVEGVDEDTFDGDSPVTREQMALFMMRYAKWLGLGTDARSDVDTGASDWAADAMSWAVAEGLLVGDGQGYDAQGVASRAEAVAIVQRFVNILA